ncbi:MAG: hypothetical protein JWO28_2567 [Hyphomicrobiales bacterium]|nr:hypothetical protein [Hyphomicrobiales bacterium]
MMRPLEPHMVLSYAQLASELIASELAGKTDPSADIFSFK